MQQSLIFALRCYQRVVSPMLMALFGPLGRCRFEPSCSQYAVEAVRVHGAIKGSLLAIWRLCRCHPWGGCGVDPVPPKESQISNFKSQIESTKELQIPNLKFQTHPAKESQISNKFQICPAQESEISNLKFQIHPVQEFQGSAFNFRIDPAKQSQISNLKFQIHHSACACASHHGAKG